MESKGWSIFGAAQNLGIDHKTIYCLLALLEAPKEIKELVKEKKLSPSDAGDIAYRLKDKPEEAIKVAKIVAKSENNRRKLLRDKIKEVKLEEKKIQFPKEEFSVIYADPLLDQLPSKFLYNFLRY